MSFEQLCSNFETGPNLAGSHDKAGNESATYQEEKTTVGWAEMEMS